MVEIEENSPSMQRKANEKLIKRIISEKFKLKNYRLIWDDESWEMDIYISKLFIFSKYVGSVYPSEHGIFNSVVISGDPDLLRETAEKLEANGISVKIQKPVS